MSVHMLCFSPTGGTKKVAETLAEAWEGKPDFVDLTDAEGDFSSHAFGASEVCIVAVPSFGGRVPTAALERLAQVRGNGAAAVLAVAFGNRSYDDTLLELSDAVKSCGFRVVAAVAASTEHSIMRQFGAGRPDARDVDDLRTFGREIAQALSVSSAADIAEPALPGTRPFRAYDGVPFKPKAGKACTKCGACARRCPVGAIPAADPSQTDKDRCISCMRCAAICPDHARTLNAAALFVAGKKMAKACGGRKPNELFLS